MAEKRCWSQWGKRRLRRCKLLANMHTDERLGYNQSIPYEWLQAPSERDRAFLLEFTRGALYALARDERGAICEVHVSRIQHAFRRLGSPAMYKVGLKLMRLMREVERLSHGYWLLTPFRVIEIEKKYHFVGALPIAHGALGEVEESALCRFVSAEVATSFPMQTLDCWLGSAQIQSESVISGVVRDHARSAQRTADLADVQYLSFVKNGGGEARFGWSDVPSTILKEEKIAICRQHVSGLPRYFSAKLSNKRLASECPLTVQLSELIFAIARNLGAPIRATLRKNAVGVTLIEVDQRLPINEFRLALLLATDIAKDAARVTYTIPSDLAAAFTRRLISLGCKVECQE
ncbi:hypothetical protein [Stenotrophomonas sp. PD6]|uniref:hypothetical protein n=1 Tax=Stenotrophomonas sp. PD6 TaxID=3368612 RepID=UPI003B9E7AC5